METLTIPGHGFSGTTAPSTGTNAASLASTLLSTMLDLTALAELLLPMKLPVKETPTGGPPAIRWSMAGHATTPALGAMAHFTGMSAANLAWKCALPVKMVMMTGPTMTSLSGTTIGTASGTTLPTGIPLTLLLTAGNTRGKRPPVNERRTKGKKIQYK